MSHWHNVVGPDQHRLKRRILVERARFRCELCKHRVGSGRGVRHPELHHVKPLSHGGRHNAENVKLWCRDCHLAHHRKERIQLLPPRRRAWALHLESYQ